MTTYEQLYVERARQKKNCCHTCSLCCCHCCLWISLILAIILSVAGGLLIYAFREETIDRISSAFGLITDDQARRAFMRTFGYVLVALGGIMLICALICSSFVCCLTPSPPNRPGVIVVQSSNAPNSPPYPTGPTPSAPPPELPPSYDSVVHEKV